MGAYTIAPSIRFNGFKPPVVFYMCTQSMYEDLSPTDMVTSVMKCGPLKNLLVPTSIEHVSVLV